MAFAWPVTTPEYDKSRELERAVMGLMDYYGQAGSKTKAYALRDVIYH